MRGVFKGNERNKTMRTMLTMTSAVALAALAGCAKEDYKDPQKFAERYVREDVERRYPGSVFNPVLQYKGFELVNVKSEMRESFSGAASRIVCEFRVVPESGVEYYGRAGGVRWFDYLGQLNCRETPQLAEGRIKAINAKIEAFCRRHPLLVEKKDMTPKPNHAKDLIYVYRAVNEDGVYVPMRAAGAGSVFRYEGVGGWYNTNEIFTARTVKKLGGVEWASEEGKAAYLAYSNACESVRQKVNALNETVAAFNSVTNNRGWNTSFVEKRLAELRKERVAPLEEEVSRLEKTLREQMAAANRKLREIKGRIGSIAREIQNIEKTQTRLASNRNSAERNVEQLRQQAANPRTARRAERQLPKQEAALADIVKKQAAAAERHKTLSSQLAEAKQEEQTAQTVAEKEQTAVQAKIDAAKAKLAEEKKSVELRLRADASARLEQLSSEIQTLADGLEKML